MIPRGRRPYWVAGTLLAFAGVGIARYGVQAVAQGVQRPMQALGILVAMGGLFVIMLGTRRKG